MLRVVYYLVSTRSINSSCSHRACLNTGMHRILRASLPPLQNPHYRTKSYCLVVLRPWPARYYSTYVWFVGAQAYKLVRVQTVWHHMIHIKRCEYGNTGKTLRLVDGNPRATQNTLSRSPKFIETRDWQLLNDAVLWVGAIVPQGYNTIIYPKQFTPKTRTYSLGTDQRLGSFLLMMYNN